MFAPVIQKKTIRLLFALSAEYNWKVHHVDIEATYLSADLIDEVCMKIPNKFHELYEELKPYIPENIQ